MPRDPEVVGALGHNLSKDSSSNEDHVLSPWWVLDTDLEILWCGERRARVQYSSTHTQAIWVAASDVLEVQLLDLLLETRWQTWIHTATAREDDVLVEL